MSIYKKTDEVYQLKLKASRTFYMEVRNKHGSMPFNLRTFQEETKTKLGVVECVNHKLIEPFQVLYEKQGKHYISKNLEMLLANILGEYVAHFKFTVLLMPNGPHKITGLPFEADLYRSEHSITDTDLKSVLNSSANPKSAKKKKKKTDGVPAETPMEVEAAA